MLPRIQFHCPRISLLTFHVFPFYSSRFTFSPMGVRIDFNYEGQLRCTSTHGPSPRVNCSSSTVVDPPFDEQSTPR